MYKRLSFIQDYPLLAKEWCYEKNIGLNPEDFSSGSNRKVWWRCSICGHVFDARINHRTRLRKDGTYSGCPNCKNLRTSTRMAKRNLISGQTDLLTMFPDIAKQWDYQKNNDGPEDYSSFSGVRKWWICDKGHPYDMPINNRTASGQGCPICAGKRIQKGFNDLASLRPEIAAEWDYEANVKGPGEYTVSSSQKVTWRCKKGHPYKKAISERTRTDGKATGCPICANKKVLAGYNDLSTVRPDVLKEWDNEKNLKLPSEYLPHTDKRVFWKCEKGHPYSMKICDKTSDRPYGCPICSGKKLLAGYNDIKTLFPNVAAEWDYERNDSKPEEHVAGTHKKAFWICSQCGNKYQASIKERTYGKTGCPKCSFYYKTSLPEQAVFFYLKRYFDDSVNSYKPDFLNGMEVDVFVPSLKLAIEYDGRFWHASNERDNRKSQILKKNGIKLIRIKEANDHNDFDDFAIIKSDYRDELKEVEPAIIELMRIINRTYGLDLVEEISIDEDRSEINSFGEGTKKDRSLLNSCSEVLKEWDYDRNEDLTPDKVTPSSRKTVWWTCSNCGKSWQQSIKTKVLGGLYCESCSKTKANNNRVLKRIQRGEVKTVADYPLLLSEWSDSRDPHTVSEGSEYKAKWKCITCGNEFDMEVKRRIGQNQACPLCGRKKSADARRKRT